MGTSKIIRLSTYDYYRGIKDKIIADPTEAMKNIDVDYLDTEKASINDLAKINASRFSFDKHFPLAIRQTCACHLVIIVTCQRFFFTFQHRVLKVISFYRSFQDSHIALTNQWPGCLSPVCQSITPVLVSFLLVR